MLKRIIDISSAAYISTKNNQLLIKHGDKVVGTIPIEDLGAVILQHPAIIISQAVVIKCQENNVIIIFCDEKYLPYSTIFPISKAHVLHTKILRQQIDTTIPTKNRIWKQLVVNKITQQINTLQYFNKPVDSMVPLKKAVKAGDSRNHEAQAAKKYWRLLFGDRFRRQRDQDGINALLNYGYAIIRAMVARSIIATGLHPSIGVFHKNQYNGLCLADDMMEPLRPFVDLVVYNITQNSSDLSITPENKKKLLEVLATTVLYDKSKMPLMVSMHYIASNIKKALAGGNIKINYPDWIKK